MLSSNQLAQLNRLMDFLPSMKGKVLDNYVLPGLVSTLLDGGKLRMFEMTRDMEGFIAPHSHRFHFMCLVLKGEVRNVIYEEQRTDPSAPMFLFTRNKYLGHPGKYEIVGTKQRHYIRRETAYHAGEMYGMQADQIHTIAFARGTQVLFFESAPVTDENVMLLPIVEGKTVDIGQTQPWMFNYR
jgi:hypothetical protein